MLTYAFRVLKRNGYSEVETEDFSTIGDLFATILTKGVSLQIRRGLHKDYLLKEETLTSLHGKIDINSSINELSFTKSKMHCIFDELSVNSYMNRILKTTMIMLYHGKITPIRKKKLRTLLLYFRNVQTIASHDINWKLHFNRNNQEYQMLISICYLVHKGLLQTQASGNVKLMEFLDDQRMHQLYQNFIFQYYKQEHKELTVSSSQIKWDLDERSSNDMLPIMQSDIILAKGNKKLIIDAKYYSSNTQSRYEKESINSMHLYQIFTYVKNYDKDQTGDVSGLLLYAKTNQQIQPNNRYSIGGNNFSAITLDLDCDFFKIKDQLDRIIDKELS